MVQFYFFVWFVPLLLCFESIFLFCLYITIMWIWGLVYWQRIPCECLKTILTDHYDIERVWITGLFMLSSIISDGVIWCTPSWKWLVSVDWDDVRPQSTRHAVPRSSPARTISASTPPSSATVWITAEMETERMSSTVVSYLLTLCHRIMWW